MQPEIKSQSESQQSVVPPQAKNDSSFQRTMTYLRSLAANNVDKKLCWRNGCRAIAQHFGSPYLQLKTEIDAKPFEHVVQFGDVPEDTWRQLCSLPILDCVSSQKPQASFFAERTSGTRMAVLSLPMQSKDGAPIGVAAIAIQTSDATAAKQRLNEFDNLLNVLINSVLLPAPPTTPDRPARAPACTFETAKATSTSFIEETANGKFWNDTSELAYHLVNGVRSQFHCLDVSFGLVVGKRIKLLAISGHDSVYASSPGCVAIEQAMVEVLDCGHALVVQAESEGVPSTTKLNSTLHHAWRAESNNCSCFSFPLFHEDNVVAVLSLRRDECEPFKKEEIDFCEQYSIELGAHVYFAQNLSQSLYQHFARSLDTQVKYYLSGRVRKIVAISVALGLFAYLALPWPHSINVPCSLISSAPKVFSAPIAGKISKANYRPGEIVPAGAILFEMDTQELRNRASKLEAELVARQQAMINYIAAENTAKAGEEKANIDAIRNELHIVNTHIEDSVVRAPEAGIIMESDLNKLVGETVALGERLAEFAPLGSQQLELRVPDFLGLEVSAGQLGHFVTSADPDRSYPLYIERIETSSVSEQGESFVKAIGASAELSADTKIGMNGFAQISVGKQPGWWILLQKPIRYLQRKVWQL